MVNKLAHHVQGFTPKAIEVVKAQRNARFIKTMDLNAHAVKALAIWKHNNPQGIISYRQYFGAETEGHHPNLSIWQDLCDQISNSVKDATPKGLVQAVYLPYNEIAPYAGTSLNEYVQLMPRMADHLRKRFSDYGNMKVIGGNWSVTTPHPMDTWDTIATALPHLDFLCLHRYSKPNLREGHNWLYDFGDIYRHLERKGRSPLPPLILGEFGIDGALWTNSSMSREMRFRGWRHFVSPQEYATQLREANIKLQEYLFVFAACVFNLDQYPPKDWESYLYSNYQEIVDVFSEDVNPGLKLKRYEEDEDMVQPKSLYTEWREDPSNEWPVGTDVEFKEFKAHAMRLTGRSMIQDGQAYQMGYPRPPQAPQQPQQPVKVQTPPPKPRASKRAYLDTLASLLQVDRKALQAVIDIESGGRAFDNGKPIIRFELHVFWKSLTSEEKSLASKNFRMVEGMAKWHNGAHEINFGDGAWHKIHTGSQSDEWNAINLASLTNREKTFRSCSFGAFQIMGFHHRKLYYESAEAMYHGFAVSEAVQAWGFVCFIMSNKAMLSALQRGDYDEFAKYYNGSGAAKRYGKLIRSRIARL